MQIAGWVLASVMALHAAQQKLCLHVGEMHARLAFLGGTKDEVRVESQPLQGCTVTALARRFPHAPAGNCACP
ncbi:MAG: hypothetical protein ABL956_13930 [Hyphomonadaceae bacterium]